jgi:multiple sugar transport system permease protein
MTKVIDIEAGPLAASGLTKRRKSPLGSRWTPYVFLGPAVVYIVIFQLVPLVQEIRLAFTNTSLLNPNGGTWVGLANFVAIFTSPGFQRTLLVTLIYLVVCVVGAVGVGLGTALLLNGKFRGRGIARALITIPWAAPGVATALIVTWMLNAQYGVINRILEAIGLGVPEGNILDSPTYALPAILLTTIWQLFPFSAVVLLSALQAVPKEVTEAASVDGAGVWWVFRAATWPVVRPTVILLAVLNAIWAMRRFELIWLMTRGGPLGSTKTLVIDLYSSAFELNSLGKAAAIGVVGIIISLLLVSGSFLLNRRADK